MIHSELESATHWLGRLHIGEVIGTLLVAVGVVIEFLCSWLGKPLQNKIDAAQALEMARLNKSTAEAHKEAENARRQADSFTLDIANANQRAAEANKIAASAEAHLAEANARAATAMKAAEIARENAESFQLEIAKANARAAEAAKEAARLNKLAEEERLARVKIEQHLADRQLTDGQAEKIATKLRPFSGQEYDVTTFWDLKEPLALANRVHSILILAKWNYIKPENGGLLLGGVAGVQVYVHPEAADKTKKAADALVKILNEQNIDSVLKNINDPGHPTNKISLNVGTKH